ncbi:hypothetical protein ACJJIQ_02055 [Microbulbifer sp. ANSA003]|uniref:hypothetical protein n=1 Tax=Microbulbifer sp. ANSA003 TaxID=3243360 RepID=UPI0040420290
MEDVQWLLELESEEGDLDLNDKVACLAFVNEERKDYRAQFDGNPYLKLKNCWRIPEIGNVKVSQK